MLFKVTKDGQDDRWLTVHTVDEAAAWLLDNMTLTPDYDDTTVGLLPVVVGYGEWVLFGVNEDGTLKPSGYKLRES